MLAVVLLLGFYLRFLVRQRLHALPVVSDGCSDCLVLSLQPFSSPCWLPWAWPQHRGGRLEPVLGSVAGIMLGVNADYLDSFWFLPDWELYRPGANPIMNDCRA